MRPNCYEEKFKLRLNDYDFKNRIFTRTFLDLCQDVAGSHANLLNIGYDDLIKNDMIWMVLRNKIEIYKNPCDSARVVVKTWPHEPGRVDMDRDYLIYGEDGSLVAKATSKWVVCSYTTRKLIRAREVQYNIDEYYHEINFDEPFDKVDFDDNQVTDEAREIQTNILDLDHNGHINNTRYCDFLFASIEKVQNEKVKKFQIDYLHELKANAALDIKYYFVNNICYAKGISNNQDCFIAKIEFE